MNDESILERERLQIQQIRELEFEDLQVEEVEDSHDSDDDVRYLTYVSPSSNQPNESNFNPALASLHTYLGEVEDTQFRLAFLDGGSILKLPLIYLEGVVLFPDAVLPLRIIEPAVLVGIERAMDQAEAPCTIGVVRVYRDGGQLNFATTGTTAEIRQYRRLVDGSFNVVTRGQQRFRLKRRWTDGEGVPCGEVQIVDEDLPMRAPRDASIKMGSKVNSQSHSVLHMSSSSTSSHQYDDVDTDSEAYSERSFESALSPTERRIHQSMVDTYYDCDMVDESTSSGDEYVDGDSGTRPYNANQTENICPGVGKSPKSEQISYKVGSASSCTKTNLTPFRAAPGSFWPFWVYRMYDSYYLAQRAADKWTQIIGAPSMEGLVAKPDVLSFHIASKIPVSESTRQELLDIDGVSYRLRREIELLETFDCVKCKDCQTVIAKRSDMLVMSSEGPLGAYVNPHGYVHEVMTFYKTNGIALIGRPAKEYSWFPGYAWTIAMCDTCETQLGWMFTANNKKLKPRSFWAVRSSQVADDTK